MINIINLDHIFLIIPFLAIFVIFHILFNLNVLWLFLLVHYTRKRLINWNIMILVIVGEITESKYPHNNNQKFEQFEMEIRLNRVHFQSSSILERFVSSLFPWLDRKWLSYVTQSHPHSSRSEPLQTFHPFHYIFRNFFVLILTIISFSLFLSLEYSKILFENSKYSNIFQS